MFNRVKYKYAVIASLLVAWYVKFVFIKTFNIKIEETKDESVRAFLF